MSASEGRSQPTAEEETQALRSRIAQLQNSVEQLGREQPRAGGYGTKAGLPPVEPSPLQPGSPLPPAARQPPPPAPIPAVAPTEPTAEVPAPEPAFPLTPPPPATSNGEGASAVSATVAQVDAGPFENLIDLRHFEEQLAQLAVVRDVRVRRYGHGRAEIQLGVSGRYGLATELQQHIDRHLTVAEGADGRITVELERIEPDYDDEDGS